MINSASETPGTQLNSQPPTQPPHSALLHSQPATQPTQQPHSQPPTQPTQFISGPPFRHRIRQEPTGEASLVESPEWPPRDAPASPTPSPIAFRSFVPPPPPPSTTPSIPSVSETPPSAEARLASPLSPGHLCSADSALSPVNRRLSMGDSDIIMVHLRHNYTQRAQTAIAHSMKTLCLSSYVRV